jgi:hypothetical protein
MTHERHTIEVQAPHQIDDVLPERGELTAARRRRLEKTGRPAATQVRRDDATSVRHQERYDRVPRRCVVGPTMEQQHGWPAGWPVNAISDFETRRPNREQGRNQRDSGVTRSRINWACAAGFSLLGARL